MLLSVEVVSKEAPAPGVKEKDAMTFLAEDLHSIRETVHQLDRRSLDNTGYGEVKTPPRHVRTRLYFTSESHVQALVNVLKYYVITGRLGAGGGGGGGGGSGEASSGRETCGSPASGGGSSVEAAGAGAGGAGAAGECSASRGGALLRATPSAPMAALRVAVAVVKVNEMRQMRQK
jgi:hypothetical protein